MNGRFIVGLCALIIGLVLCASGLWLLLSPLRYQAVTQIKIEPDLLSDLETFPSSGFNHYDPNYLEAQARKMVSDTVLSNAVQSLSMDKNWAKNHGRAGNISADEEIEQLRRMISTQIFPNTKLVNIRVIDEDPHEAAQIANTVAMAYVRYRIAQHKQQMVKGIQMLEDYYEKQGTNIQAVEAQLEQWGKQFNATNSAPSLKLTNDISYANLKQHLDDEEKLHQLFKAKIESEKKDVIRPRTALVEVTDPALPPKTPIWPSHFPGAAFLIFGVIMSGFGIYIIARHGAKFPKPRQTGHEI